MSIHQPHDTVFKSVFSNAKHAGEELQSVLPSTVLQQMQLGSLQRCAGDFLDDQYRKLHTDLLFSVPFGGERALVLMEHQSKVDRRMPVRLWNYLGSIWRESAKSGAEVTKLPLILPVIVHHGVSRWSAADGIDRLIAMSDRAREVISDKLPRLSYYVDDLAAVSDADIRARPMSALPKLTLFILKNARHGMDFVPRLHELFDLFKKVGQTSNGDQATAMLLRYILQICESEPGEIGNFAKKLSKQTYEIFMTGAEQLEQRGRDKERRRILLKQLEQRFGKLSAEHEERVRNADGEQLQLWVDRIMVAETLEEVFK